MDARGPFAAFAWMPWTGQEMLWPMLTLALSVSVVAGYALIAFNWRIQSKLRRSADAKAALARLGVIFACCLVCGLAFARTDVGWWLWRVYDGLLLVITVLAWRFAARMRGMSLVDERLGQVDELERTADKYRDIAELLPHMVWMANADGDIDFCNRRWRDYAGADGGTWLDAVHPDEWPEVRAWWRRTVVARQAASREVRLGGRGQPRAFVVSASPVREGDVVKWLGACADVEDQKRLAAEREMHARRQAFFLNALSHDLRAPLNTVALHAHVLKMSARDAVEVESVNTILESALAAGELVTRLLDFAKVGSQDHNEIAEVGLGQVLQQTARRFAPLAEQKGLYLRIDAGADVVVRTDRLKLERVINNLVDNAIKYTRHGGVSVGVSTRDGADDNEDGGLSIRVADTGIGIAAEHVPYLFDEFYQVNNHARDPAHGFGIGLAICRCLARQLGGDVRLDGTGPDGSRFELTLGGVRTDRRGRPGGAEGDRADPGEARLCHV